MKFSSASEMVREFLKEIGNALPHVSLMRIVIRNLNFFAGLIGIGIAVINTILSVSSGSDLSIWAKVHYFLAALNFVMWIINRRYGIGK